MISKALIINDDHTSLMIATKFLHRSGFADQTVTATDGQLGLSFFESLPAGDSNAAPEFIFLDLFMPVMNGWDFLDIFSKKYAPNFPGVRIAIMSAYVDPEDQQRLAQYDVVLDFISTPMNLEKLAEVKQKYLDLKNDRPQQPLYSC
ncbi:MAG: response regulator [Chitinophagaceae bacterium]|nr:response regulator [Chitinophagaceae bacterium]